MKQNTLVVAIVSGAICFTIGFVGGALLTMPNREKTKSDIAAVEAKANEKQAIAQEKLQTAEVEVTRLRSELKRVTTELKQAKDNLAAAKETWEAKAEASRLQQEKQEKTDSGQKAKVREKDTGLSAEQIRKMDADVSGMLSKGTIYSINIEFNEVRIDPILWAQMDVRQKQGLVLYFSQYFDAKGSTGRVTILSSRNDAKLATYSVWTGVKIIE